MSLSATSTSQIPPVAKTPPLPWAAAPMLDHHLVNKIFLATIWTSPGHLETIFSHPTTYDLFCRLLDFQPMNWWGCQTARNSKDTFLSTSMEGWTAFYPLSHQCTWACPHTIRGTIQDHSSPKTFIHVSKGRKSSPAHRKLSASAVLTEDGLACQQVQMKSCPMSTKQADQVLGEPRAEIRHSCVIHSYNQGASNHCLRCMHFC